MIYWLGSRFKLFRKLYYKVTKRWRWGLFTYLDDKYPPKVKVGKPSFKYYSPKEDK